MDAELVALESGQAQGSLGSFFDYNIRKLSFTVFSDFSPLSSPLFMGGKDNTMLPAVKSVSEPVSVRPHRIPRRLYEDEVRRLLSVCDPVERVVVEFAIRTGVRPSELRSVRREDVNLEERSLFVYCGKRSKDRVVPFDSELALMLRGYIREWGIIPGDYLFCVKHKTGPGMGAARVYVKGRDKFSRSHLYKMVSDLAERAGLQQRLPDVSGFKRAHYRMRPHILRHTALSLMVECGGDLESVKEIAGHSSIVQTEVYLELAIKKKKRIVDGAFKFINQYHQHLGLSLKN